MSEVRHAKGYRDYALTEHIPRHAPVVDRVTSDGEPFCVCEYPVEYLRQQMQRNAQTPLGLDAA